MKRIAALLLVWMVVNTTCDAQGFYFRTGAGYAFPLASQTADASGSLFNGSITRTTIDSVDYDSYKIKKASFTAGAHVAFGLGYMFSEHVGIDAALDFGISPTKNVFDFNNIVVNSVPSNVEFVQKASLPVMFSPSLVLQTAVKSVELFSRLGIVMPVNSKITLDRIFTSLPGYGAITVDDETWEIRNKFSMGMTAAMGVQKKMNNRMKLGAEVSFLSMSIITKQAKMTQYTSNGQKYNISSQPDSLTNIIFSNNFTSTSNNFYHQPAYTQPFGNIAFNIRLVYSLGEGNSRRKSYYREQKDDGKNFIKKH